MNRTSILTIIAVSLAGLALPGRAQTPGSIAGVAAQVDGAVVVASVKPGGCPTRICTTNFVTTSHCFSNLVWKRFCVTNAAGVQCTNVLVPVVKCFTNTFPEIRCTNVVAAPVTVSVGEMFGGPLSVTAPCDDVPFPSNAVFQAVLFLNLRTNDWVGTQVGSFKILDGTNVLASGSMTGIAGLRSHRPGDPCSMCNHFEGTLRGLMRRASALSAATLEASYAADILGATCPSADVPQGQTVMVIDGVAVVPCALGFEPFASFNEP